MKIHCNIMALLIAALSAGVSSCNPDIFISDDTGSSDTVDITLQGDNSTVEIDYQPKGLKSVYLDCSVEQREEYTYTNRNGHIVSWDVPPSELSEIGRYSPVEEYAISFRGNKIYFSCTRNAGYLDILYTLCLDYGEVVRYINVTITPGQHLEMVVWEYDHGISVEDNAHEEVYSVVYNNTSDNPLKVIVKPYQSVPCGNDIEPGESWALNQSVSMPVPVYNISDGEWYYTPRLDMKLGWPIYFLPDGRDIDVPLTIPPHTSQRVTVTVKFCRVTSTGTIDFRYPGDGVSFSTPFKSVGIQPVDYSLSITEE